MKAVNASIITIGDELLIGQTIDTNSAFIASELNKIGIWVRTRIAVGDDRKEILQTLEEQSKDCRIIVITGGLGPTNDDITKKVLCEFFDCDLVVNQAALENVRNIFSKLDRPLTEINIRQADVPSACIALPNKKGTAPGMWFEKNGIIYISLPGVPNEMKGIMEESVIPKLSSELELPAVVHCTLLTSGIGESALAETIRDFEYNLPAHIKLAYLPAYGMVRLRLTSRGDHYETVSEKVNEHFNKLKNAVKKWLIADADISLDAALFRLLRDKNKTLSTAESCTGGYIAHLLTKNPGSSQVYFGTVVCYSNEVKQNLLGVKKETLDDFGAVSEQTVLEMVKNVRNKMNTDYAIATSGIMGPGGGSDEKPSGTVWIAVGNQKLTKAVRLFFRFDRERNIEMTSQAALTMLYRFIIEQESE